MDPTILLLLVAAAGGYYVYTKQTPAQAEAAAKITTTQVAVDDPAAATAVAAAQAAGITPTEVRTMTAQATVIAPGASTATQQSYSVTTVNTNPGDPTQGIYLASEADKMRMAGNYVPNPPTPAPGSAVANLIWYSGTDLRTVLSGMATGQKIDNDGTYRMTPADWNYYRQLWGSGMNILTEAQAGAAWGHRMNQEEYLTAVENPVQFAQQYAGHVWA